MHRRHVTLLLPWVGVIMLLAFSGSAQTGRNAEIRRICVVGVHDSSLFTVRKGTPLTPGSAWPSGWGSVPLPDIMEHLPLQSFPEDDSLLDRARPDWQRLARTSQGICASGWMDLEIQNKIEQKFSGRKGIALVESVEDADLIFLCEGIYRSFYAYATSRNRFEKTVNLSVNSGNVGFGKRVLQAAMAIVVPSEVYRAHPADSAALLAARLWEGAVVWEDHGGSVPPVKSASPGILVDQFLNGKKATAQDIYPVSPAWTLPPATARKAGVPHAPRLDLKGVDTSLPSLLAGQAQSAAIKVNVSLVTVPVIASDLTGNYVPGLRERDFHLYENDRAQRIDRVIPEAEPFRIALLLDISNSTTLKHADIQTAALAFGDALRPEDRLLVASFGAMIRVHSEFTGEREQFRRAILGTKIEGGTRLFDAVDLIVPDRFDAFAGRKAIVLFTDGVDTSSRLATAASSLARIEESDVVVYVIQYDTKSDPGFGTFPKSAYESGARYLRDLSSSSGGRLFNAATVSSLSQAFQQVAQELRHQYTICYYPANQVNDGSYRRIRVTSDQPEIRIRARPGYRMNQSPSAGK